MPTTKNLEPFSSDLKCPMGHAMSQHHDYGQNYLKVRVGSCPERGWCCFTASGESYNDSMEPEDALFVRDLDWVVGLLELNENLQGELHSLKSQPPVSAGSKPSPVLGLWAFQAWCHEHRDLLSSYPDAYVSIDPQRGIVVHSRTLEELETALAALPQDERQKLYSTHTSVYLGDETLRDRILGVVTAAPGMSLEQVAEKVSTVNLTQKRAKVCMQTLIERGTLYVDRDMRLHVKGSRRKSQ